MSKQIPRVGIFISTLEVGGAERVAVTLANEIVDLGISTDLVLMNSDGQLRDNVDYRVNIVDFKTKRGRYSYFSLLSYILKNKPTAIVSLLTVPNMLLGLTRLMPHRNRPKLIGSEHSYDSDIYRRNERNLFIYFVYSLLARFGYRLLDTTVAVSFGVERRLVDKQLVKSHKIVVIPNPINLRNIPIPNQTEPITRSRLSLLAVGRLDSLKDYDTMFRAIDLVRRELDVVLNVLGEGNERKHLTSLIAKLSLDQHVKLIGNVIDTTAWYREADALVLSSVREGFAMVIVEALAHGIPVVSTDCLSGPSEILNSPQFGILVPVGDYNRLAEAIKQVAHQCFDAELLRHRAEDFDSRLICLRYLAVLLEKTAN